MHPVQSIISEVAAHRLGGSWFDQVVRFRIEISLWCNNFLVDKFQNLSLNLVSSLPRYTGTPFLCSHPRANKCSEAISRCCCSFARTRGGSQSSRLGRQAVRVRGSFSLFPASRRASEDTLRAAGGSSRALLSAALLLTLKPSEIHQSGDCGLRDESGACHEHPGPTLGVHSRLFEVKRSFGGHASGDHAVARALNNSGT